ncbi:bifunctional enoyl-CoA hydratase/phosphate acetyltransferase [bacterium]|nr:bifunctional enoyl-CoA hydratase/phosphate acetyltransferase [bacterium]
MITSLQQVVEKAREFPTRTVAVVVAEQESALESVRDAMQAGLVRPLLFGAAEAIREKADKVGLTLASEQIMDMPDDLTAAEQAVLAVRSGEADILMKGQIHTDDFLRAVLHKEKGLRSGNIMSHVFILDTTYRGKLTFVTDAAMNIAPDLPTKAAIIMNAVFLTNCFGLECPKVGVLAAAELVNPDMPATVEAAALAGMEHRGQFPNCTVDGPFALDNAINAEAARVKGIGGEVAGDCDILLCPNIEAGNILAKAYAFMCGGQSAGVLVGAAAPVVLTSRADSAAAKLYSIATAMLTSNMARTGRLKVGRVHF